LIRLFSKNLNEAYLLIMKRKEKSIRSKSFKSRILSFLTKKDSPSRGNNFDLWDNDQPKDDAPEKKSKQEKK